ncbi:type IV secretory system conjugative DNA transfer family protein [Alteromonadaceae bacterium M269]|nr:type IV secretory system conjugative DNA transfer family protein [Alteromonadaceae bacterium M269]
MFNQSSERFGSAGFATLEDIKRAGLLKGQGLHHGYTLEKHPQQINLLADTPTLVLGSAGSQKYTTHLAYQAVDNTTSIVLDAKGEIAATTAMLMPWAEVYLFNPFGLWTGYPHFLPSNHRFNVLDILKANSPTLFDDALTLAKNLIEKPKGGNGSSMHFYGKAVQIVTALLVYLKEHNEHASLADLYNLVGDISGGGQNDYFLSMHYPAMQSSKFHVVRIAADEMLSKREMAAGEFASIMSTISNALQVMGSPALQMALSGKSTISFADFIKPDKVRKLFIMVPAHMLESCAPIIRCMVTALAIEQQRSPRAHIHFILDECAQLGTFDLLPFMMSYLRGAKAKVTPVFQNAGQIFHLYGNEGADTIIANAQAKIITGASSERTGKLISELCGKTTYRHLPQSKKHEGHHKRMQAFHKAMKGESVTSAIMEMMHQDKVMQTPEAVARDLITVDEVLNLPPDIGLLYLHGLGVGAYKYLKLPYFKNKAYAHQFLPNPYRDEQDRIFIPATFGRMKAVKLITEKVPKSISQLPQYEQLEWSYPAGFNPAKAKFLDLF